MSATPAKRQRIQSGLKPLPELDIFSLPKVQNSIEDNLHIECRPAAVLNSNTFIEFNYTTGNDEYLRLYETELYMRMKIFIEKPITKKLDRDDWKNVSICNNFMNSLFKQVEFWIGDRLIDPQHQTYAYKTYLEKLMGKSSDVKRTSAKLGLWYENFPDNPENLIEDGIVTIKSANPEDSDNYGEGKEFELLGKIHLPMFEQRRTALLGGCKLKLRFIPNDPQFFIKCNSKVRVQNVEFTHCSLHLHGIKVHEHIWRGHEYGLQEGNARYFLLENFVIPQTINKGTQDVSIENLHNGIVPNRAFVVFVDHRAFNGSHSLNPYNFQNFGINYLQMYVNGAPVDALPKTPNFKKSQYAHEYWDLFKVTNQSHIDTCITIRKEDFPKGFNIFSFRLVPDIVTGGSKALGFFNPIKTGSIRLHLRFDEPLTSTITALIYMDFDTILELTKERSVLYDFV